ncbi:MAG TPA: hypothetical protein ENJ29_09235 [Bacteroidetes bacterium]|nr:hypothetical protein [Bacteroidota bacterium]
MNTYRVIHREDIWNNLRRTSRYGLPELLEQESFVPLSTRLLQAARWLGSKIISLVYRSETAYFFQTDGSTLLPQIPTHPAVSIRFYDGYGRVPEDIAHAVEMPPGEGIAALFVRNRLAAYVRTAFKDTYSPVTHSYVGLSAGSVYLYGYRVFPEFSHKGLYAYLLASAAKRFLRKGFGRVFVGAAAGHTRDNKEINQAGFSKVRTIKAHTVFGIPVKRTVWIQL